MSVRSNQNGDQAARWGDLTLTMAVSTLNSPVKLRVLMGDGTPVTENRNIIKHGVEIT